MSKWNSVSHNLVVIAISYQPSSDDGMFKPRQRKDDNMHKSFHYKHETEI